MFERQLKRNPAAGSLGGVNTGIANYFGIDTVFINLAVIGLTLLGLFFLPIIYLILWLLLPIEGQEDVAIGDRVQIGFAEIRSKFRAIFDGIMDKLAQIGLNN